MLIYSSTVSGAACFAFGKENVLSARSHASVSDMPVPEFTRIEQVGFASLPLLTSWKTTSHRLPFWCSDFAVTEYLFRLTSRVRGFVIFGLQDQVTGIFSF